MYFTMLYGEVSIHQKIVVKIGDYFDGRNKTFYTIN